MTRATIQAAFFWGGLFFGFFLFFSERRRLLDLTLDLIKWFVCSNTMPFLFVSIRLFLSSCMPRPCFFFV